MAIHEIRETLQASAASTDGQLIVQKRINLQPGKRHKFMHMDFFDDNISGATNDGQNMKMQVYVTNYPIVLSDDIFHSGLTGDLGPLAGDDEVLFKAIRLSWSTGNARWYNAEFPNNFLGSSETFTWYTPHLYFTVIWQQAPATSISRDFAMSFYAAVDSVDVDSVEYGMGVLQEYQQHQMRLLTENGVLTDQAEIIGAMPMWQIGGIRPEIMTGFDPIVTNTSWYLDQAYDSDAGEVMQGAPTIRATLNFARAMVGFDEAFGTQGGIDAPDWFKQIAHPFPSITTGPVRANFPPVIKLNNGNTEMV